MRVTLGAELIIVVSRLRCSTVTVILCLVMADLTDISRTDLIIGSEVITQDTGSGVGRGSHPGEYHCPVTGWRIDLFGNLLDVVCSRRGMAPDAVFVKTPGAILVPHCTTVVHDGV